MPFYDAKRVVAKIGDARVFRALGLFTLPAWVKGIHLGAVVPVSYMYVILIY